MKMKCLASVVSDTGFAAALMLCVLAASATNALAQRNRWDGYPNWGGSYDLRQTALNAGYNEGSKAGRDDRGHGRRSDLSNFSVYRNANKDYNNRYGDRELYQRYFRLAFENGYNTEMGIPRNDRYDRNDNRDSNRNPDWDRNNNRGDHRGRNWDRYGSYGGSSNLRQTALNAGYNEGIKQGRSDRSRNRRFDFSNQSAYQKATTDYSSKLGDRELYRRYYREGFENGYTDGYNGY